MKIKLVILQVGLLLGVGASNAAAPQPPAKAASRMGAASLSDMASAVFGILQSLGSKQFSSAAQLETYLEEQAFDNNQENPSVSDWVSEYQTAAEDLVGGVTKIGSVGYANFIKSWQNSLSKPGEPASYYDAVEQIDSLLSSGGSTPVGKYSLPDGYTDHLQWLYKNSIDNTSDVSNLLQQLGNKQGYLPVVYDASGSTFNTGSGAAATQAFNEAVAGYKNEFNEQGIANSQAELMEAYESASKNITLFQNEMANIVSASDDLNAAQQEQLEYLDGQVTSMTAKANAAKEMYNELDPTTPIEG